MQVEVLVPKTSAIKKRPYFPIGIRNAVIRIAKLTFDSNDKRLIITSETSARAEENTNSVIQCLNNVFLDPQITSTEIAPFYRIHLFPPKQVGNLNVQVWHAYAKRLCQLDQPLIGSTTTNQYSASRSADFPNTDYICSLLKALANVLRVDITSFNFTELIVLLGLDINYSRLSQCHSSSQSYEGWAVPDKNGRRYYLNISSNAPYSALLHELIHFLQPTSSSSLDFFREATAEYLSLYYSNEVDEYFRFFKEYVKNHVQEIKTPTAAFIKEVLSTKGSAYGTGFRWVYGIGVVFAEYIVSHYNIAMLWTVMKEMNNEPNLASFLNGKKRIEVLHRNVDQLIEIIIEALRERLPQHPW